MIYISFDELLPSSLAYGHTHDMLFGVVTGMGIMGASLVLLKAIPS